MRGKVYIAPCTGLQVIPGTVLNICSVKSALFANSDNTAVRSCREIKTVRGERSQEGSFKKTQARLDLQIPLNENKFFLLEKNQTFPEIHPGPNSQDKRYEHEL